MRPVSPGYFATAGVRMLRGRDITDRDLGSAPGVVVINESFAKRHFPGENPIGHHLQRGAWWPNVPTDFEIIGVIADERFLGLSAPAEPATYFPHPQVPFNDMHIVIKGAGDVSRLAPAVRSAIWSIDRDIPLDGVQPMELLVNASLARTRFISQLLGLFAAAALLLAAMGIHGVLSYAVAQRTPEIGIRMALGAQRRVVLASVVGHGVGLALIGILIGSAAALLATRALAGFLFGITPTDPVTFAAVGVLIAGVAIVAASVPAFRASRVDPVIALRG
jgi:predicted permease